MQNNNGTLSESRPANADLHNRENGQYRVELSNEQQNTSPHNVVPDHSQQQPGFSRSDYSQSDYADESPELLRWRADNLLDEMMLGAVDISAGEPGASNNGSSNNGFEEPNFDDPGLAERGLAERGLEDTGFKNNGFGDSTPGNNGTLTNGSVTNGTSTDKSLFDESALLYESTSQPVTDGFADYDFAADPHPQVPADANPTEENRAPRPFPTNTMPGESRDVPERPSDETATAWTHRVYQNDSSMPSPSFFTPDARSDTSESSIEQAGSHSYPDARTSVDNADNTTPSTPGNGTPPSTGSFTPSFVATPFPTAGSPNPPASTASQPEQQSPTERPQWQEQPQSPAQPDGQPDRDNQYLHPPAAVESQLRRPSATGLSTSAQNGLPEGAANVAPPENGATAPDAGNPQGYGPQRPDQILNEYITNQAYQREQERKQYAIMSGRSNDYPASVPRSESYPDSAAASPYGAPGGVPAGAIRPWADGADPAYSGQSMPFADAMAVGPQARRRSNMLPRQSMPDMNALSEEIFALQEQVEMTLPLGRDTADRARHLVEKAHSILGFGVERAAEVSYYIQQVRAILQRVEQRVYWSNIYRRRLQTYLTSWLGLSAILLLSCILYSDLLQDVAASLLGMSVAGLVPLNVSPFLFAFAAGAAGSSAAALFNMWQHGQKDYGFFDRKYGMLGIVLPVIGVLVGSLLYVALAGLYALFGFFATGGWTFGAIPAILAFLFGCVQERIYGTSD